MSRRHILHFPRTRGRPKKIREEKDMGTPELQAKRMLGETAEALDACLARGLISEEQHWCGIHFRWLYTLRYGAPSARIADLTGTRGLGVKNDDPLWREARETEYHSALLRLNERRLGELLTDICIHNERPYFLLAAARQKPKINDATLDYLREGLDILATHWRRGKKI